MRRMWLLLRNRHTQVPTRLQHPHNEAREGRERQWALGVKLDQWQWRPNLTMFVSQGGTGEGVMRLADP